MFETMRVCDSRARQSLRDTGAKVGRMGGAAVLALILASACSPPVEDSEVTEPVTREVKGTRCGSAPCWYGGDAANFALFNYGRGMACGVPPDPVGGSFSYKRVSCGLGADSDADHFLFPLGRKLPKLEAPTDIKSLAIEQAAASERVYILGTDNILRVTSSVWPVTRASWDDPNYQGFATYSDLALPLDDLGAGVCLKKIDVVYIGNFQSAPTPELLGLGCTGKVYYLGLKNGARVWYRHSTKAPWSTISSSFAYEDFGHADGPSDPYLLYLKATNVNQILRVGGFTFNSSGVRTWLPAQWLPVITNSAGTVLKPVAVGGPWVITDAGGGVCPAVGQPCNGDDDRFWRFNHVPHSWTRLSIGTPTVPGNATDVAAGQPLKKMIADAATYRASNGLEFGVWHHYSRVYGYRWP